MRSDVDGGFRVDIELVADQVSDGGGGWLFGPVEEDALGMFGPFHDSDDLGCSFRWVPE